jgi:glutamyl-tRNA synthetase
VQVILDGMKWLGLDADEGPFYQTERYPRYREVIRQWLAGARPITATARSRSWRRCETPQLARKAEAALRRSLP